MSALTEKKFGDTPALVVGTALIAQARSVPKFFLAFTLFLFATVFNQVVLLDDQIQVPAQGVHVEKISLAQRPALVDCSFSVANGAGIRVALLAGSHLEQFESGLEHEVLISTPYERSGHFQYHLLTPGEYALLLDNRTQGRMPVAVDLKVALKFPEKVGANAGELSSRRRLAVAAISLAFFLAVAAYAGRRFLAAGARH